MSKESLKEDARRHEQKEEWPKALDLYLQAIAAQVDGEEPDIALHNRVGDLQIRLGDVDGAVANYEQAIDLYLEVDLPNNAIAVCRKIIRNDPKRPAPFLRMGQIRAKQGFVVDARQNYVTYAEMMQARGKTDEALAALEEFVGLIPSDIETRVFLAEQLVVRERPEEAVGHLAQACRILVKAGEMGRAHELQARIEQIAPGHPLPSMTQDHEEAQVEEVGGLVGFETTSLGVTEAPAARLTDEEELADDLAFGEIAFDAAAAEDEAPLPIFADEPAEDDGPLPIFDDAGPLIEGVTVDAQSEADLQAEEAGDPGALDFSLEYEGDEDDESLAPDLPLLTFGDEAGIQEEASEDVGDELPVFEPEASEAVEAAMQEAADPTPDSLAAQGHRLLAAGDEEGGTAALERAHVAFARIGEARKAMDVVRALLEARPDRLELLQVLVEYAYQSNDESLLVQAFLELGDALSGSGMQARAEAVYRQVLGIDANNARAKAALEIGMAAPLAAKPAAAAAPPPPPPPPPAPARQRDDEYVDLGSLVLEGDEEKSTRWVVAAGTPSGDEAADFARMLSQFKDKVAQNLSSDDAKSHYDLGTAYKEMGLLDEAIEEFQRSLRADPRSLGAFEMLGQCFLDKGEPAVAIRTLERGMKLPTLVEDDLLGVYYFLGKANESIGNSAQAREFYEKIFSLDINFKDVTDRLRALR